MTQAELWQLQLMAVSNTSGALTGTLTIVFAYLVAAYFVGARLSRFQAALISAVFVIGAGLGTFLAMVEFRRAAFFMDQLGQQFGVPSISPNALVIPLFGVVLAMVIPASVFFMYQIRRSPRLGANT